MLRHLFWALNTLYWVSTPRFFREESGVETIFESVETHLGGVVSHLAGFVTRFVHVETKIEVLRPILLVCVPYLMSNMEQLGAFVSDCERCNV